MTIDQGSFFINNVTIIQNFKFTENKAIFSQTPLNILDKFIAVISPIPKEYYYGEM